MILKSYLFCLRQNNYVQYPNDHTASFLKPLCGHQKEKHQVVVYRDGGLMYYCYLYNTGGNETIGLCFATGLLCTQLKPLYDRFINCLVLFARRGVIFRFGEDGGIQSIADFTQNTGEVEELFRWIKEHNESGKISWDALPPEDHTISKGASVLFNFEEDDHRAIVEATRHYTYVFITMHNPTPTSYSETVKRLSSENETLLGEKEELSKRIDKINKQKKQYELVIGLAIAMFVGALIFIAVISDKNTKIKNQLATIQSNEETIADQGNTIFSQNYTINEQSQSISRLENRVANLENEKDVLKSEISTLKSDRESIIAHKPFIVTHTNFSFDKGQLTVYYYAPSGGTTGIRCRVVRDSDDEEIYNYSYSFSNGLSSGNNEFTISGLTGLSSSQWYRFEIYSNGNFCGGGRH